MATNTSPQKSIGNTLTATFPKSIGSTLRKNNPRVILGLLFVFGSFQNLISFIFLLTRLTKLTIMGLENDGTEVQRCSKKNTLGTGWKNVLVINGTRWLAKCVMVGATSTKTK